MPGSTTNFRDINASPEQISRALTAPAALETWQVPGDMKGKVHNYEGSVGGGYQMSLYYPGKSDMRGKTTDQEDRFTARYLELLPGKKIVQAVTFDTSDPNFFGEMIMTITIEPKESSTRVTFSFTNIPDGIDPRDNEAGTLSSLEKLAQYVEG